MTRSKYTIDRTVNTNLYATRIENPSHFWYPLNERAYVNW